MKRFMLLVSAVLFGALFLTSGCEKAPEEKNTPAVEKEASKEVPEAQPSSSEDKKDAKVEKDQDDDEEVELGPEDFDDGPEQNEASKPAVLLDDIKNE